MQACGETLPERALFVSPVVDMGKLISNMMLLSSVSEERLARDGEVETDLCGTLSWRYFIYAREHPITKWPVPTAILYAGRDELTDRKTIDDFVGRFGCELTVMEDGEHWFHTASQLEVLKNWEEAHTW